jgi:hypothetical protein
MPNTPLFVDASYPRAAPCPQCGSTRTRAVPCLEGPNHAALRCAECNRWLKWLPKPAGPAGPCPPRVLALALGLMPLARLHGTERQVEWARTIRAKMLSAARRDGDAVALVVTKAVADSTWFIANQDRQLDGLKWPDARQLAGADAEQPADVAPPEPARVGRSATPEDLRRHS